MLAELLDLLAALEALHPALDHEQRQPAVLVVARAGGDDHEVGVDPVGDERLGAVEDVVAASRLARVLIAARSEPVPGSVIAIARICSPAATPGSHRSRCSSSAEAIR